jgi:hypothetical protein
MLNKMMGFIGDRDLAFASVRAAQKKATQLALAFERKAGQDLQNLQD